MCLTTIDVCKYVWPTSVSWCDTTAKNGSKMSIFFHPWRFMREQEKKKHNMPYAISLYTFCIRKNYSIWKVPFLCKLSETPPFSIENVFRKDVKLEEKNFFFLPENTSKKYTHIPIIKYMECGHIFMLTKKTRQCIFLLCSSVTHSSQFCTCPTFYIFCVNSKNYSLDKKQDRL